jgi:dimethylargininase
MLMAGKTIFAGLSSRTNEAGVDQLEKVVLAEGYRVERVTVRGCLHLKTAVTSVSPGVFLANPAWIDLAPFQRHEIINVPDTEPWGANTVAINESMLVAESAPRTCDLLRDRNLNVVPVNISELQKAEAGLSCLSLLYRR